MIRGVGIVVTRDKNTYTHLFTMSQLQSRNDFADKHQSDVSFYYISVIFDISIRPVQSVHHR